VALERATYQGAAFLFPRSEFLRRSLIDDYGCDPERVIRVGGGANLVPASLEGKAYGGRIALFVGSDFERKGGLTLLEAWQLVVHMLPNAQLWIVGPKRPVGPPRRGVRWLGHLGDRRALARLYAKATLFVLPSRFEPWGHVFFEAMAHGLPCIGSSHGATPEIVRDGHTGLLVPAEQPDQLALALFTLLQNEELAAEMGRRAYGETLHGHTWDAVVRRMGPFIEQAAGGPKGAAGAHW
jgi:glycosyltransferase involved in cell wall biosynthesis